MEFHATRVLLDPGSDRATVHIAVEVARDEMPAMPVLERERHVMETIRETALVHWMEYQLRLGHALVVREEANRRRDPGDRQHSYEHDARRGVCRLCSAGALHPVHLNRCCLCGQPVERTGDLVRADVQVHATPPLPAIPLDPTKARFQRLLGIEPPTTVPPSADPPSLPAGFTGDGDVPMGTFINSAGPPMDRLTFNEFVRRFAAIPLQVPDPIAEAFMQPEPARCPHNVPLSDDCRSCNDDDNA